MKTTQFFIIVALLLLPVSAWGQEKEGPEASVEASSSEAPSYQEGGMFGAGLVIGLKAGGGFGQVFSDFGASFVGELELGYNLPFHDRNLGLYVTGAYSGPSIDGQTSEPDPRLPADGSMSYEVTQHQAIIGLGLIYRIPIPLDILRPYVSAGARMHLMRTDVMGSAGGEAFGENSETGMSFGAIGALGGELYLGPGALLLEVQAGWAPVDGFVLRDTNVGSLNVALGYRIFL